MISSNLQRESIFVGKRNRIYNHLSLLCPSLEKKIIRSAAFYEKWCCIVSQVNLLKMCKRITKIYLISYAPAKDDNTKKKERKNEKKKERIQPTTQPSDVDLYWNRGCRSETIVFVPPSGNIYRLLFESEQNRGKKSFSVHWRNLIIIPPFLLW